MKIKFLELGKQPITNSFLIEDEFENEFFYDLSVGFDEDSKLVSLMDFVSPEKMFNDTYSHRASMSTTMRESFKTIACRIEKLFNPRKVLEIGSNDGAFIRNFKKDRVVAVEPCKNLTDITKEMGYITYPVFWNRIEAENIAARHGTMDIIYSANTICHIPDLTETFMAVENTLADEGVFIFEDPSLLNVIMNGSYDQFYDEHAHVFSVMALYKLLKSCGMEIIDVENLSTHGGSNRIYAKKSGNNENYISSKVSDNIDNEKRLGLSDFGTYARFGERAEKSKNDLIQLFKRLKEQQKRIISYGATYKSTTIFNYCKIGTDYIDYITDTTKNKQGKVSPGMHIPIISPEEGFNDTVDYAFLGAWNFQTEIMDKEIDYIARGGKFITHVPEVHII